MSNQHLELHEVDSSSGADAGFDPARRSVPRVVLALAAVVLVLVGASALAVRLQGPEDIRVVTLLAATQEQRSAHVTATMTGLGPSQPNVGYIDFVTGSSSFVIDGPTPIESRQIGPDTWTTASSLPPGKKWLHLPPRAKGKGAVRIDPQNMLEVLTTSGGKATDEGKVRVDGRDLRRYQVTGLRSGTDLVVEVFLDGEGLLRRLVQRAHVPTGATATITLDVLEYSDAPVVVEAPPADQVVEFGEAVAGMAGALP